MEKRIEMLEKSVMHLSGELKEIKELIGTGSKKVATNFDSIKKEIDSLHGKVDILNKKVDRLEGNTTDGFEDVGLKLENLTEEISKTSMVTKYDEEFNNLKAIK
jgi:predicted  nucleic acid-binding Zn-ribbon protein